MKRARHSSYHTGTRVSGPPSPVSPGARFTKYLTTTLRYDKAKVTIDLRRTSNLQNMLRKTQGFPVPILRFKVRSTDAAGSRGRAPGQGVRGAKRGKSPHSLYLANWGFVMSPVQIFHPCLLLSSSTGYQTFKHGFQISKHFRAFRHVKIGPEVFLGMIHLQNRKIVWECL